MTRLCRKDRRTNRMQAGEIRKRGRFTNVDYLLNAGKWARAEAVMAHVKANLIDLAGKAGPVVMEDDSDSEADCI